MAKIFWVNYGNSTMYVDDINPSSPSLPTSPQQLMTNVNNNFSGPCGIFIDEINNKIYWVNYTSKTMYVDNINPSSPSTPTSLIPIMDNTGGKLAGPTGIFVDTDYGKIYWVNYDDNTMYVGDIDPTNPSTPGTPTLLLDNTNGYLNKPEDIFIDIINDKIYWVSFADNTMYVADIDRSSPAIIGTPSVLMDNTNGNLSQPSAVFVDTANSKIYWATYAGSSLYVGDIDPSNPSTPTAQTLLMSGGSYLSSPDGIFITASTPSGFGSLGTCAFKPSV